MKDEYFPLLENLFPSTVSTLLTSLCSICLVFLNEYFLKHNISDWLTLNDYFCIVDGSFSRNQYLMFLIIASSI